MIAQERLYEAGELPCACVRCGWDNDGRLVIVDRYATDYPPIPRLNADAFVETYRDSGGDPDDRIVMCPQCDNELDREGVVERDFRPGDVIHLRAKGRMLRDSGPYTVLDPVRTRKGKLRLRGPRGGYMTTWWTADRLNTSTYRLEVGHG